MNVQEYISSGMIESYVLGLASAEERREMEKICAQYPEVLQARIDFEISLEQQARENAIEPPAGLKEKIVDRLSPNARIVSIPATLVPKVYPVATRWWKIAAAACFLLLAGTLYWNLSLQKENKKISRKLNETNNQLAQVKEDIKVLQGNPAIKMARMDGTANSPQSFATVYWDTTSHDVYLLVNNLPQPATNEQYQLWALLDGTPVDMGMLEISEKPLQLYRMKNTQAAQAFAITLEKKGGSPTPQGKMYAMGKL